VEWVRDNTGFAFGLDPELMEVPEPTMEELDVLRHEIDPEGVLQH
jgi:hypothetical protein